jgi:hypothetical protein
MFFTLVVSSVAGAMTFSIQARGLIFVVKARSLKGSTFIFSPLGLASGLTQNFKIRLIELARNKRSSLLGL